MALSSLSQLRHYYATSCRLRGRCSPRSYRHHTYRQASTARFATPTPSFSYGGAADGRQNFHLKRNGLPHTPFAYTAFLHTDAGCRAPTTPTHTDLGPAGRGRRACRLTPATWASCNTCSLVYISSAMTSNQRGWRKSCRQEGRKKKGKTIAFLDLFIYLLSQLSIYNLFILWTLNSLGFLCRISTRLPQGRTSTCRRDSRLPVVISFTHTHLSSDGIG